MTKTESTLAGCIIALLFWPFASACYGWTLSILWKWFLTPQFHISAPPIAACIGITLVVRFITNQSMYGDRPAKEYREELDPLMSVFGTFAHCGVALLFGLIVRQFV